MNVIKGNLSKLASSHLDYNEKHKVALDEICISKLINIIICVLQEQFCNIVYLPYDVCCKNNILLGHQKAFLDLDCICFLCIFPGLCNRGYIIINLSSMLFKIKSATAKQALQGKFYRLGA